MRWLCAANITARTNNKMFGLTFGYLAAKNFHCEIHQSAINAHYGELYFEPVNKILENHWAYFYCFDHPCLRSSSLWSGKNKTKQFWAFIKEKLFFCVNVWRCDISFQIFFKGRANRSDSLNIKDFVLVVVVAKIA